MYNPYLPNNGLGIQNMPYIQQSQTPTQTQDIVRVHGEDGAKAYALAPNSSVLLMDETDNVIWAKMTDGAGYATLRGFRITPIETAEPKPQTQNFVTADEFDELKSRVENLIGELND